MLWSFIPLLSPPHIPHPFLHIAELSVHLEHAHGPTCLQKELR